jgi:uncharacterized protein (DUF697 family)
MAVKIDASGEKLRHLVEAAPIPVLLLLGKTGSGKTSIIRYLTGADDATIGSGFRPQTRLIREYRFPDEDVPLVRFLDTRGLGEADYDPRSDLAAFNESAHLVIVTVRAMDQAVEAIARPLRLLRKARPDRPVLLVLTALHDGYPGEQHRWPDPFDRPLDDPDALADVPEALHRSIDAHLTRFGKLVDHAIAIDLTPRDEGFDQPELGGERLKRAILELLPSACRQALLQLDEIARMPALNRRAATLVVAHSALAATGAAFPLPWVDIPLVLGIQSRLAYKLARLHRQPLDSRTLATVSAAMGGRIAARMALREVLKFIPVVGSTLNAATTFALTCAAGFAWNWYFMSLAEGHVPTSAELREVWHQQLRRGEELWKAGKEPDSAS